MTIPVLEASGLLKRYAGKAVVDGVGLRVHAGEVLGLLGPNGAGKTTTLRLLYGLLQPEAGTIRIQGEDVTADLVPAKRLIGVCTQDDTYDGDFTVRQNLQVAAGYFRPRVDALHARIEALLDRFGLREFAAHKPERLSGGYKRRLMIARALVHGPRLLFLDEPTTGLDPQARTSLWQLIAELRREGLGIILTTHYMDEAERLADRLVVLRAGKVLAEDAPRAVLGRLLGEHIVVCPALTGGVVAAWLSSTGRSVPPEVLGQWHLALDAAGLVAFTLACGAAEFEVRKPTLDDLFLHLSGVA